MSGWTGRKPVYLKPRIEQVRVENSTLMSTSDDGPIIELPSDEVPVYPDGEGKDPADALGKGHSNMWDDRWNDGDGW